MKSRREKRGINLLFFNIGVRLWRLVNAMPRPLCARERDNVPVVRESVWVLEPVWTGETISLPLGFDPRAFQLVACRCTCYAIPPHLYLDNATKFASRHFFFLLFLRSLWHVIQQHNELVNFIIAQIFGNRHTKTLHTFQAGHRPSDYYTTHSYEICFNIILPPQPQFKRLNKFLLCLPHESQYILTALI